MLWWGTLFQLSLGIYIKQSFIRDIEGPLGYFYCFTKCTSYWNLRRYWVLVSTYICMYVRTDTLFLGENIHSFKTLITVGSIIKWIWKSHEDKSAVPYQWLMINLEMGSPHHHHHHHLLAFLFWLIYQCSPGVWRKRGSRENVAVHLVPKFCLNPSISFLSNFLIQLTKWSISNLLSWVRAYLIFMIISTGKCNFFSGTFLNCS